MIVCVCVRVCNDGDNRPGPTQESQDLGEMAPSLSCYWLFTHLQNQNDVNRSLSHLGN